MDYETFTKKYIKKFEGLDFIYWPNKGFIVWRVGTGENVELLHIRTFIQKKGCSTELVREMIKRLKENPPYYSVFGFSLTSNPTLKIIYKQLGFNVTDEIPAPYKDGNAIIFWQDYNFLKKKYLGE